MSSSCVDTLCLLFQFSKCKIEDRISVACREKQREYACTKFNALVPLLVLSFELISDP
jgi:hypothetical protein